MRRATLTLVVGAAMLAVLAVQPGAEAGSVDLAVSFGVINSNTSRAQCAPDGAPYTVRGHLTGPPGALEAARPAVTVYLYGFDTGEWNYRFREVAGYDFPAELAENGHVSLTIDMLGYDASGHPHGLFSCLGAQADVTHQIVGQLRAGTYAAIGGPPIPFSHVVLAGHDVGGTVAQVEAYSYSDIDGLIVMGWADQGFTPYIYTVLAQAVARCATGGEEPEGGGVAGGYMFFGPPNERFEEELFVDVDPAVITTVLHLRNRNPCGYLASIRPAITADVLYLGEVSVPVLLLYSDQDPVFSREGREQQKDRFTGSPDVSIVFQPRSGHFPMFERNAAEYRTTVSDWLLTRGFVADS